jgi:Family of unknown function (DUF6152)
MMRFKPPALGVIALLVLAAPALAHHSASMFDMTHEVSIEGTVKDFQWTNPHSWLLIEVAAQDGSTAIWSFEAGPPSILSRMKVRKSDFVAGEKVTVHAWIMKDDTKAGLLKSVQMADGSVVQVAALEKTEASSKPP